jgi:hypothetical protein
MRTIKLKDGAFNEELLQITGSGKVGWRGEDHDKFVNILLSRLVDEDDQPVVLEADQKDGVKLILRPTDERQRNGLKRTFAAADFELDGDTEDAFALLFSVAQFSSYVTATDPQTQTSLVAKSKRRAKKATLKALLTQKPVAKPDEPVGDAENPDAGENDGEPDVVPPAAETKPANPKKAAGKL